MTKKTVALPRTFATRAYLQEVEPRTFMLFRNVEAEVIDEKTGKMTREKVSQICMSPFPLREYDPKTDDERQIVLNTFHPVEQRPMKLVEVR